MNQNKSKMYFNTFLAESGSSYWKTPEKEIQNACRESLTGDLNVPGCLLISIIVSPLLPGMSACGMEKHYLILQGGNCSGLRKKESLCLKPVAIPSKLLPAQDGALPWNRRCSGKCCSRSSREILGASLAQARGWLLLPDPAPVGPPACSPLL